MHFSFLKLMRCGVGLVLAVADSVDFVAHDSVVVDNKTVNFTITGKPNATTIDSYAWEHFRKAADHLSDKDKQSLPKTGKPMSVTHDANWKSELAHGILSAIETGNVQASYVVPGESGGYYVTVVVE